MTRPIQYNSEAAIEVCARIQNGDYLKDICADPDLPSRATVALWRRTVPSFALMYSQSEEILADLLFDQAQQVADDSARDVLTIPGPGGVVVRKTDWEVINRSRLRVDTLLKRAAKLNPRKYGDKPDAIPPADGGVVTIKGGLPD